MLFTSQVGPTLIQPNPAAQPDNNAHVVRVRVEQRRLPSERRKTQLEETCSLHATLVDHLVVDVLGAFQPAAEHHL